MLVCRFVDPDLYKEITAPVLEKIVTLEQDIQAWKQTLWHAEPNALIEPPEEQYAGSPAIWTDLSDMDHNITKLDERKGGEVLTGGTLDIFYYNQGDKQWSGEAYGSDTIGGYGCGPTVMAMVISSLTEEKINPVEMAAWAEENHHWASRRGSYLSIIEGAAEAYGLHTESCQNLEADRILQELVSGKLIVALMTKGHFTQGGHFILLRGATLDGGILVADPSSRERSLMVWDVDLILNELSLSRNNGAPLWILTPKNLINPSV